jgi:hypothetical protein
LRDPKGGQSEACPPLTGAGTAFRAFAAARLLVGACTHEGADVGIGGLADICAQKRGLAADAVDPAADITCDYADEQDALTRRVPDVSLAKARERRTEARRLVADGIDPSAQRKTDKIAAAIAARPRGPITISHEPSPNSLVGVTLKPSRPGLPVRQPAVFIANRHLDLR